MSKLTVAACTLCNERRVVPSREAANDWLANHGCAVTATITATAPLVEDEPEPPPVVESAPPSPYVSLYVARGTAEAARKVLARGTDGLSDRNPSVAFLRRLDAALAESPEGAS